MPCPCDCVNVLLFWRGEYLFCEPCLRMWKKVAKDQWVLTDGELGDDVQPLRLGYLNQYTCPVCGDPSVPLTGEVVRDARGRQLRAPSLWYDDTEKRLHQHTDWILHYALHCPKGHQWHTCSWIICWCGRRPTCDPEFVRAELIAHALSEVHETGP